MPVSPSHDGHGWGAGLAVEASAFRLLRDRAPAAVPMRLPRWVLGALSHAVEDEYLFQSRPGAALACFQRQTRYRAAERRWRALSDQSELAAVFADFRDPCQVPSRPLEVPIGNEHPLAGEWVLICDCVGWSACLAGVEVPPAEQRPADAPGPRIGARPDSRLYEASWTVDPSGVRAVARLLLGVAEEHFPQLRGSVPVRLLELERAEPASPRALRDLSRRFAFYARDARRGRRLPGDFEREWGRAGAHERLDSGAPAARGPRFV